MVEMERLINGDDIDSIFYAQTLNDYNLNIEYYFF